MTSFLIFFPRAVLLDSAHRLLRRNRGSVIKLKKTFPGPGLESAPVEACRRDLVRNQSHGLAIVIYTDDIVTTLDNVISRARQEAALGTLEKLKRVAKKTGVSKPVEVKPWLEQQDAYTLHRPVRKRFPRNTYSVDNIMDVWECDLVDVQALSRHNDGVKYLLTVIDVFSKFLHMVPLFNRC